MLAGVKSQVALRRPFKRGVAAVVIVLFFIMLTRSIWLFTRHFVLLSAAFLHGRINKLILAFDSEATTNIGIWEQTNKG